MARLPLNPHLLAWIDVETGGLDETHDPLLEIAAIVTGNDLAPVDAGIAVTIRPAQPGWRERLSPFIVDMHTRSGLLADVDADGALPAEAADRAVADYLARHSPDAALPLAGNSITLDRNFLRAQAPATFARLHYRSLDVTSVSMLLDRVVGTGPVESTLSGGHRGLADLHAAIDQARRARDTIRGLTGGDRG